jgi:hypothetical protein
MKESKYRLLCAVACGMIAFAAAIWCLAAMMSGQPLAAMALGIIFAFCVTCCRIQLHDRHIAKIKENWRRS